MYNIITKCQLNVFREVIIVTFDVPVSDRILALKKKREWGNRHLRFNTE
jgi:hypothetical protein